MKSKQVLLREAKELKQKLAQVERQIDSVDIKRMQKIAGILKENQEVDDSDVPTITVDGMTGIYLTTVGQAKLYSSESTETGSNFDYFIITPGREPKTVSVQLGEESENPIQANYVMKETGIRDPALCKAIATDINQELGFSA